MKPIYITETPGTFRLSFEYNPKLIEIIKRVPSGPKWDSSDKVWVIKKESILYPPGRDARWYVEQFAQWTVHQRYCSSISRSSESHDVVYEIPPMKEFTGDHFILLNPYPYQLEGFATLSIISVASSATSPASARLFRLYALLSRLTRKPQSTVNHSRCS